MMINNLWEDLLTIFKPIADFACYVYRFLSKFVMICLFMDFFNRSNYLWWDMYHWTRDHWYFSTILVLILSYITYKQAKAK